MIDAIGEGISWFPQNHAHLFYMLKGITGGIAVLLVIFHMNRTWERVVLQGTSGQQLRYLSLLGASVLIAGSSLEQAHQHALVNYRNLGAFVVVIMIIFAMIVSITEDVYHKRNSN